MTEPAPGRRRRDVLTAVVGSTALVGGILLLPIVVGFFLVQRAIDGDGPPGCDREPVLLEWVERDGAWFRSAGFELVADEQTVQVDVSLLKDGGVIQLGKTVYAVPAGEAFPESDEPTSTTQPFPGVRVGHGVDAVNEQVDLGAGAWELIVRGGAAPAEVRWPC